MRGEGGIKMKKEILGLVAAIGLMFGASTADASKVIYPTGKTNVAVGDLTGDGKPELVYIGELYTNELGGRLLNKEVALGYRLVVEENMGDFSYKTKVFDDIQFPFLDYLPSEKMTIQITDLDGDGLNDIILKKGSYLRLLRNEGNLKFKSKYICSLIIRREPQKD